MRELHLCIGRPNLSALDFVRVNNLSHCEVVGESGDADSQQAGQKISHDLPLEQATPGEIAAASK